MAVMISLGDFCICLKQKLCDFPLDFQDSAKNNEVLTSSEKKKTKNIYLQCLKVSTAAFFKGRLSILRAPGDAKYKECGICSSVYPPIRHAFSEIVRFTVYEHDFHEEKNP